MEQFVRRMRLMLSMPAIATAAMTPAVGWHIDRTPMVNGRSYTSSIIQFAGPMDQAVLSWNVVTPEDSRVDFFLRARPVGLRWSAWFPVGTWGAGAIASSPGKRQWSTGQVDVDTVMLHKGAAEWQYRLTLSDGSHGERPQIAAIALAAKNSRTYEKTMLLEGVRAPALRVPSISQFEVGAAVGDEALGRRICSPASVTMLLRYLGVADADPIQIAQAVYDRGSDMYGNWPFNTARLYELLRHNNLNKPPATYVRWYESLDELLRVVATGTPVIVSVKFAPGELAGAPVPTPGHLLVVRGADQSFIYVNDPAAPTHRTVPRKYRRDQFLKAWKGIAYVVER